MRSADGDSTISSALVDLRQVPLAEMLTQATLDEMLQRVLPRSASALVLVAAFSSAI
jgi:hypothetical protein